MTLVTISYQQEHKYCIYYYYKGCNNQSAEIDIVFLAQ